MNNQSYKIVLIHRFVKSKKTKTFKNIETATNWMFQRILKMNPNTKIETVIKNINKALENHTPYGNWYWEKIYENKKLERNK